MDKTNTNSNLESIIKLDSLNYYAKYLPEELKIKFLFDVADIKKHLAISPIIEANQSNNKSPDGSTVSIKSLPNKPALNSAFSISNSISNIKPLLDNKKITSQKPNLITNNSSNLLSSKPSKTGELPLSENQVHSNFIYVTDCLVPRLTEEGKRQMGDLSFPIELYKALKLIDDKTSILDLSKTHAHSYGNFIDFCNLLYKLELDKYISFIRTEDTVNNDGWIRIGEIFIEGNVTSDTNIEKAASLQKTRRGAGTKGMFIGEALLELNMINEDTLRNALKVQRWFSKLSSNSIFIKKVSVASNSNAQNSKLFINKNTFANILDFIIPVFNTKGQALIADPLYKDLSEKLLIINGESSIEKIFNNNRKNFNESKLNFLKFLFKLEFQDLLYYKKNNVEEREIRIKLGELLICLDLINEEQLEEAFNFRMVNQEISSLYIGEVLVKLNSINLDTLQECLKIQKWCNNVLAKISYENAFVESIKDVLKDNFNCPVEIGSFKKVSFNKALENIVCIIFPITGKLNGKVYYILDSSFAQGLTKTLMATYGMSSDKLDESIISEISNIITGNSLTRLSNLGLFCETNLPTIVMDKEIIIADKKSISVIPLMNQWGRFAIGLEITD